MRTMGRILIIDDDPSFLQLYRARLGSEGPLSIARLTGSETDDLLTGGSGRDVLNGGAGNDRFIFNAGDTGTGTNADLIRGFDGVGTAAGDRIDLSKFASGVLTFRGTADFSGVDQVRVHDHGSYSEVDINLSGDHRPEAVIQVDDGGAVAAQWRAADFFL